MKHKTILKAVISTVFALAIVPTILAVNIYTDHKRANVSKTAEIYVTPGMGKEEVLRLITDSSYVSRPRSLKRAFKKIEGVKVGHYTLTEGNTSVYVSRMLSNGWQTPVSLVLSGAMRRQGDIARKISRQLLLDSLDVIKALRDSAVMGRMGFSVENGFALFIPDTYEVYWTDSIETILSRQKKAYDGFWTEDNKKKAKAQGLSQMEVSILASIVKGESNYVPEFPSIAGVYLNRLHKGMKLQADPTIAYCFDYRVNRILKKHLQVDSPFNTYKHAGLPPAPICVPTKECLQAVLNPDVHGYLFFCANPDFSGSHLFARTYSEHLKNARAFQRALTARNKAK